MASKKGGADPVSPFLCFGRLLRFYRHLSVFPAKFQNDFFVFRADWKVCLRGLLLIAVLLAVSISAPSFMGEKREEIINPSAKGGFDTWTFRSMANFLLAMMFIQLFYFYKAIPHLDKSIKLSTDTAKNLPNVKPILHHHYRILVATLVISILFCFIPILEHIIREEPVSLVLLSAIAASTNHLAVCLLYLISEVPVLLLARLLQVNTERLKRKSRELNASTNPSINDYLASLDQVQKSHQSLTSTFGPVLVPMTAWHSINLIFGLYNLSSVFVKRAVNLDMNVTDASFSLIFALFCGTAISRLLHITNYAHQFTEQVETSLEDLIELRTKPEHSEAAAAMMRRYKRMSAAGLSANGFFKVERGLIAAILGHMLTYVIILVEFKLNTL